jgi:methylated-DNA-[protein]-cysteine S-methyltransferase
VSLAFKFVQSPVGRLRLAASEKGLVAVLWEKDNHLPAQMRRADLVENTRHPTLLAAEGQLGEYFAGKRRAFDLDLDLCGTKFQIEVWQALLAIPYGETRSYGQLARQLGNRNATRAVGAANGRNPIPIIVPCHRVIGASGKLTGFGGGLDVKAQLLDLESRDGRLFNSRDARSPGVFN